MLLQWNSCSSLKCNEQDVFVKRYAPGRQLSPKSYIKPKCHSQGRNAIELDVIQKGIISGACLPNMKCLSLTVQKL